MQISPSPSEAQLSSSGDLLAGHVQAALTDWVQAPRATRLPGQAAAQLAVPEGGAIATRYYRFPQSLAAIPGACGHWAL